MFIDNLTTESLGNIYVGLLGLAILVYAILDGYDLGIGVLLPVKDEGHNDKMIASIGPYWDANETWLVLAVGILLIAFPAAHSELLQSLYLPATVMLLGLILRGVSFDFRAKVIEHQKQQWDLTFKLGSLITTLAQGYMLGIYVTGLRSDIWAQGFAALSAVGVTAAYVFIGACWLIAKTTGDLRTKAIVWAKYGVLALVIGIAAVSLANLTLHENVRQLWLSAPTGLVLSAIPVLSFTLLGIGYLVLQRLPEVEGAGDKLPFFIAAIVFTLCFSAFALSYYPYVIPGQMTISDTLSNSDSLKFLLIGAIFVVPCILLYTVMVYRIFSGKLETLRYY